ncbi:TPA: ATPase, partial [Enterococcus faecium]|nr:ATPase [Enterococcus faecium]HAR1171502.1 ATPase [Enterococcus faecium]HBK6732955.1 ATPase [Enterococcus faecium]HCR9807825.1 ATPase [Enterococcus faecium]
LDRGVQQCQMYMAMTLIWNQALIQGRRQRRLIKEKQMEEQDFKRFLAMIDECHNGATCSAVKSCGLQVV